MNTVLHVQAGTEDWAPTEEELKNLADLFHKAVTIQEDLVVVATRTGIDLSFEKDESVGKYVLVCVKVNNQPDFNRIDEVRSEYENILEEQ